MRARKQRLWALQRASCIPRWRLRHFHKRVAPKPFSEASFTSRSRKILDWHSNSTTPYLTSAPGLAESTPQRRNFWQPISRLTTLTAPLFTEVQLAYYRLLSAIGQEDAAHASLANAQTVQQAAEERLANGLATLPDVLEARSATAQAEYDLQAIIGAEEVARGDLATAVGALATAELRVQPLDELPTPESISDTVDQAINRALVQRPDLLQQLARIRSAQGKVKEEKAAYYPSLSLTVRPAIPFLYGLQQPSPWAFTSDLTGAVSLNLNWTVFDGGARKSRLAQADAEVQAEEADTKAKRNQITNEIWTAYSNLNTAFRQRQAAMALLESASQSYSAALESYNYGLRNLLDVTAAQRSARSSAFG